MYSDTSPQEHLHNHLICPSLDFDSDTEIKDKFIKSKSTAEKQLLKQELVAQHKMVQIAQQKFSNMLMIEPADDLDESVKKKD